VRSEKSWKTIEPENAGSLAPPEACVTLIVRKLPLATVAAAPPEGLLVVTVKVWGLVLPPVIPSSGT